MSDLPDHNRNIAQYLMTMGCVREYMLGNERVVSTTMHESL
jgi:hypothetical protein